MPRRSNLNLNINAGRKLQLLQRINGLAGCIEDVNKPLVRPRLELLTRLFVDVRRTIDGVQATLRG